MYFQEIASYNIWANQTVTEWLRALPEEQWNQPITSSFVSIASTALHIVGAETIWLDRLLEKENPVWLPGVFRGSRTALLMLWAESSENLKSFVDQFDSLEMDRTLSFKRINGDPVIMKHYHIFAHVFNHSTYHRGQLVTMLRQVGYEGISSTDMLHFFREKV
ncbi:MAG: DinB family protein [Saprospiraceae bacterium]|jgi:uncharacterized damage-inducible protein DinB|nr:DinB family protein [Saprospiraceae bacterium]